MGYDGECVCPSCAKWTAGTDYSLLCNIVQTFYT